MVRAFQVGICNPVMGNGRMAGRICSVHLRPLSSLCLNLNRREEQRGRERGEGSGEGGGGLNGVYVGFC